VLDLSNVESFEVYDDWIAGQTPPFPDIVRDVVLDGNYAYVAAGAGGLRVIDITDPTSPREVGVLEGIENAFAIDIEGALVYLGDYGPSGLHIIDISDPASPRELGAADWRAGIWEISVVDNYAYVADGYDMFIFDVTNPNAPRQVGQVGTGCSALDVAVAGNYAYIADDNNCGLIVADVSDPTVQTHVVYAEPEDVFYLNPKIPSRYQSDAVMIEVDGNFAYVINHEILYSDDSMVSANLTVYDISDPAMPNPIGRNDLDWNRPYSEITDFVIDGNFAYLSHADGGVYVADLRDLRVANIVDSYQVFGPVQGVVADGGEVTAVAPRTLHRGFEDGLERSYSFLAQTFGGEATNWVGNNGLGYLTTQKNLIAIDLHGTSELLGPMPQEIGRIEAPKYPFRTAMDGSKSLLFYQQDNLIHIIDTTNPNLPVDKGSVSLPNTLTFSPNRVVVGGGIAFLFYWDSPPWMVDLRGTAPAPLGFLGEVPIEDLTVVNNVAYLATGNDGLKRYDLANPEAPRPLDRLPDVATALRVRNTGPYLFVADADKRLHIFNTVAPEPSPVAVLHAPYELTGVAVLDDQVFVAAGDSGLWSYSVPGMGEPEVAGQPTLVFDNFPLSEALLLYIDEGKNLALENVETGAIARLIDSGDVASYSLSPTRQHILYSDVLERSYLLSIDFRSDGRLQLARGSQSLPILNQYFQWSPDGTVLAFKDKDSRLWLFNIESEPILLPVDILSLGGWSYDSQWFGYCTTNGTLEIRRLEGEPIVIDRDIDCNPIMGGPIPAWSPTALQVTYVRGKGTGFSTDGLQPIVYDVIAGEYFELPINNRVIEWSPDGRSLALGRANVGIHAFNIDPVELVGPQGNRLMTLPGGDSGTLGRLGWWPTDNSEPIFINQRIAIDFSAADPVADALLAISADGRRWITGRWIDPGLEVFCGTPDTPYEHSLISTDHVTFPDASVNPLEAFMRPAVSASLSPLGNFVALHYYQGGLEWTARYLPCDPAQPLPFEGQMEWTGFIEANYSASEQWLIRDSWMSGGGDRQIQLVNLQGDTGGAPRDLSFGYDSPTWLITPDAAPPVTQVDSIVAPDIAALLDRKTAVFEQLETVGYQTSAGVLYPDPIAAFDETAARALIDGLGTADPATVSPEQAAALERLVMQEETLAPLLDDYTVLASDQADVAVDLAGMTSGSAILAAKSSGNIAAAIGDLLGKTLEDFIKLLLRFIDDEDLREGMGDSVGLAITLLGAYADNVIDAGDASALVEEFLERAQDDSVRALAFRALIPAFTGAVQPVVDQGVNSVTGAGDPVWTVGGRTESAQIGLDGLTEQSAIMRELAHDVYANSLGRGRDVNELLKDIVDLALLGTKNPIGLIFSIQTRLQQILIDTAASSVLSGAMTCTRDAALLSGEFAFLPDRPVHGCKVPVPLDLGDFFRRLLTEKDGERHYVGRLASPAQSTMPEFDAALAGYRAAIVALSDALNAADPDAVRARTDELLAATRALDEEAMPVMA